MKEAAMKYGIPASTLRDCMKRGSGFKGKGRKSQKFTEDEEISIANR